MARQLCRVVTALLMVMPPVAAQGQWLARPFATASPPADPPAPGPAGPGMPSAGHVVLGSVVGGAAGLAVGYAIGYPLLYAPDRAADLQRGCEDCGLSGALETAALMVACEALGVALGAHLGNARAGSLGADLAASLGSLVIVALVAGAAAQVPGGDALAVVVPIGQIAAVVLTERGTARAKARR